MALLILGLVGLAIGIWLGLPGRYEQTPDDIDRLMAQGGGTRRRRQKRSISPVAWLQRKLSPGRAPPTRRRAFTLEAPGPRPERSEGQRRAASPGQRPDRSARSEPPRLGGSGAEREAEEASRREPRTRKNLREGRFKLRPPGESGSG